MTIKDDRSPCLTERINNCSPPIFPTYFTLASLVTRVPFISLSGVDKGGRGGGGAVGGCAHLHRKRDIALSYVSTKVQR